MLGTNRASMQLVQAQVDRARLSAAADAGIAIAIHGLGLVDPDKRLAADGQRHAYYFDGVSLDITIQDEKGKIAINQAPPDVERRLFAAAGVSGSRLDILVDSLEDWKDYDDMVRPNGAERSYYAPMGIQPRNDGIRTLDELADLRGMDADLLGRIAPAITPFAIPIGSFNNDTATPLALMAMSKSDSGFDVQKRLASLAGEHTALEIKNDQGTMGAFFSIVVDAHSRNGGRMSRTVAVTFTGDPTEPYWVRYVH
jgi:general secretion pathway protein K